MIATAQLERRRRALVCALVCALALTDRAASAAGPEVRAAPPDGFEDVEVGVTWVDAYWAGGKLGQFEARFIETRLTFSDPDAVVDAIPGLINEERVREALSGPLNGHRERVCGDPPKPGCGTLQPSVAGVIFDPERFRVDVFVAPVYFSTRRADRPLYLASPDIGGSFLAHLRAAVAGAVGEPARVRLVGDATLAYDQGRVRTTVSQTPYDGLRFDSVTAEHDGGGVHLAAGLFDVHRGAFLRLPRLVGVVVSTPRDTLYDARQDAGTPIVVFLDRPSRVTLSRDGRLLTGARYDRGLRELDTRALPFGAYPVDIEIREEGGVTRTERRFFVKSVALPPSGHPWWYVAAGALVDPGPTRPVLRAETLHRVGAGLGLGGGLTLRPDIALAEGSAVLVGPGWELRATAFTSTDLDVGASVVGTVRTGRLYASATAGHVHRGGPERRGPLLPLAGSRLSGSVGLGLGSFDVSVRGGWQRLGVTDHVNGALSARWTLLRSDAVDVAWTADGEWSRDGFGASTFLRLALRLEHLRVGVTGGVVAAPSPEGTQPVERGRVDAVFDDGRWSADQVRAVASLARHDGETTGHAGASYRGVLGELEAAVDHRADPGRGGRTSYSADLGLSVAVTQDGPIIGGRRAGGDAALVVRVRGDGRGGAAPRLRILIKDQLGGAVAGGTPEVEVGAHRVFHLRAFRRYEVSVVPAEGALVEVDPTPRHVTLFPGNVESLVWDVSPILVVYGRAVTPDGSAVSGATVLGYDATTDPAGWFQVEVGHARELSLRAGGEVCRIRLTGPPSDDGVMALGEAVCR